MTAFWAWQNLMFVVPLALSILLVFVGAVGIVDMDADFEVPADAEAGEAASETSTGWSLLGLGRVPLSILLMIALGIFGGVGLCSNLVLAGVSGVSWLFGLPSAVVAMLTTLLATGRLARLIVRLMPTTETYATSKPSTCRLHRKRGA